MPGFRAFLNGYVRGEGGVGMQSIIGLGSHEAPVKEVSHSRLEAVIEDISGSPAIDLSHHCLLLFETGGRSRRACTDDALRGHGRILHTASALPFPLSLIPSHYVLIGFQEPSSLKPAFDRLQPYNASIIYAPQAFQAAFLTRLRSGRSFNPRARLRAMEYRDLLVASGENYFAVESNLDYDTPLVRYICGDALSLELQELLDSLG